jgi:hypothetical protein
VRMPVARAAPIRRTAGRAIVGARMVARPAVVPAVALEAAAILTPAAVFDVAAAANRRIAADHGPLGMTRFATRVSAGVATTGPSMRSNRSAAGRREQRQREHGKRAFHLSPLRTWLHLAAGRKVRILGARLGRYHWYRRHNRQNPTNRKCRVHGSGFSRQFDETCISRTEP